MSCRRLLGDDFGENSGENIGEHHLSQFAIGNATQEVCLPASTVCLAQQLYLVACFPLLFRRLLRRSSSDKEAQAGMRYTRYTAMLEFAIGFKQQCLPFVGTKEKGQHTQKIGAPLSVGL